MSGILGIALGCASAREPLLAVPKVDRPRYMGEWYVIASIPGVGYDTSKLVKVPHRSNRN